MPPHTCARCGKDLATDPGPRESDAYCSSCFAGGRLVADAATPPKAAPGAIPGAVPSNLATDTASRAAREAASFARQTLGAVVTQGRSSLQMKIVSFLTGFLPKWMR